MKNGKNENKKNKKRTNVFDFAKFFGNFRSVKDQMPFEGDEGQKPMTDGIKNVQKKIQKFAKKF